MADNKSKRGGSDRGLIALSEPYEVRYWSKKFKVTPAKLRYAVKKVGHSSKKVEAYLTLQKHKARDKTLIAVSQPHEVRYWSKKFKGDAGPPQDGSERSRPFLEKGRRLFRGCQEAQGEAAQGQENRG